MKPGTALPLGSPRRARGFTLLEAIVALTLISSAGLALFSWVNSNMTTLSRVEDASQRAVATTNALEFMQTVNPMQTPQGEARLGAYRIRWQAEPLTDTFDGANFPYGVSLYQFSLYNTRIELAGEAGAQDIVFELKQVGYRRVRDMAIAPL
ncbi:MAG: hypothetical protein BGP21_02420 [Thiobacillus sp. 65-29]|nr:MAG: hypothetical protein BGP21_02420 [Thiobacillus sp. 65-29]